ncbi:unnamed protein product [Rotaria sordida]|uniref:Uncharacterized protein n=1 Tax=Rotaria sordida TaxID=392033 RepID=A0A814FVM8_9BILA|nr:unnamed protein product [Rotaria sordida]CAF1272616.1 unnamed protein product [Rotaria sordida]
MVGTLNIWDFTYTNASLAGKHPSLLTSLTINNCTLPMEHIESLLSQTPALNYLKLISCERTFDTIFDGYNWEQFILNKLSQLNQFEYFFSFTSTINNYMKVLNHVLASFQTPFWLQEKRWFTICGYVFGFEIFELHTTKINMTDSDNLIKFEKLAENNTYRFVGQPSKYDSKKGLNSLNLAKHQIGDQEAQCLAEALKTNNVFEFDDFY